MQQIAGDLTPPTSSPKEGEGENDHLLLPFPSPPAGRGVAPERRGEGARDRVGSAGGSAAAVRTPAGTVPAAPAPVLPRTQHVAELRLLLGGEDAPRLVHGGALVCAELLADRPQLLQLRA